MLDEDLAEIYGISTGRLNEQVKRNVDRFPTDFMFQLSKVEWENLKSQNAISSWGLAIEQECGFSPREIAFKIYITPCGV